MSSKILSFFSTKSVSEKIIKGELPESQLFTYFYLIFMYDALGLTMQCLSMIGRQATLIDIVNVWGYLIISGIGLLILYLANGGGKGKSFVSKFFAFSFTVGYKYAIFFGLFIAMMSKFIPPNFSQDYEISVYVIVNFLMLVNIAYRMYETRHL